MVVIEIATREDAVIAFAHVDDGRMGLDILLLDQPAEHFSNAIGAVTSKAFRIEPEAFHRYATVGTLAPSRS